MIHFFNYYNAAAPLSLPGQQLCQNEILFFFPPALRTIFRYFALCFFGARMRIFFAFLSDFFFIDFSLKYFPFRKTLWRITTFFLVIAISLTRFPLLSDLVTLYRQPKRLNIVPFFSYFLLQTAVRVSESEYAQESNVRRVFFVILLPLNFHPVRT